MAAVEAAGRDKALAVLIQTNKQRICPAQQLSTTFMFLIFENNMKRINKKNLKEYICSIILNTEHNVAKRRENELKTKGLYINYKLLINLYAGQLNPRRICIES